MPLSPPTAAREKLHTRSITVDAYKRDDGLWDLEAELIDVKTYDFPRNNGSTHEAGKPIHHMHLRVTIDEKFTITAAEAAYDAAPYGEFCASIAPDYRDLVGLNLLRRFRHAVRERFGRAAGCTHLTELAFVLPTVAIQSRAGERRKSLDQVSISDPKKRPFQIDGCHALRADGPVVKKHYPKWYEAPKKASS